MGDHSAWAAAGGRRAEIDGDARVRIDSSSAPSTDISRSEVPRPRNIAGTVLYCLGELSAAHPLDVFWAAQPAHFSFGLGGAEDRRSGRQRALI
jgi:hypothetical protein